MANARKYEMCIERDRVEMAGMQETMKAKSVSNMRDVVQVRRLGGRDFVRCKCLGIFYRSAHWLGREGRMICTKLLELC